MGMTNNDNDLQTADGKLEVTLVDSKSGEEVGKDTYDSVFYGTGRRADTSSIGLDVVGVKVGVGSMTNTLTGTYVPDIV